MKIYYRKKHKNEFYEVTDYKGSYDNCMLFTTLKNGKICNIYLYGSNFKSLDKAREAIDFDIATSYGNERGNCEK